MSSTGQLTMVRIKDPGIPRPGINPKSEGTNLLIGHFDRKLHENERIGLTGHATLAPPTLGSATESLHRGNRKYLHQAKLKKSKNNKKGDQRKVTYIKEKAPFLFPFRFV